MKNIADYHNFDYKNIFWTKNRLYEHCVDVLTLQKLLRRYSKSHEHFLDAGCGYGRLSQVYVHQYQNVNMFDYAQNLLDQAKKSLSEHQNIVFKKGDLYNLPYTTGQFDTIISIRTLHHITNCQAFFSQISKTLKKGGVFIFDVPNKLHLLNRLKAIFLPNLKNIYSLDQLKLNDHYVNHHPQTIETLCKTLGLKIISKKNTNLFRNRLLKTVFPQKYLAKLDVFLQDYFTNKNFSPSIYYTTIKE